MSLRLEVNKVLTQADAVLELDAGSNVTLAQTESDGRVKVTISSSGGGSGSGLILTPTAVKTSGYAAAAVDFVPVDTTSGNVTVTLPTASTDGSVIGVKHVAQGSANHVTVAAGGSDVFNKAGGATTFTLSLLNQGALLQYNASGAIWYVLAEDFSLATLDSRYTASGVSAPPTGPAGGDLAGSFPNPTLATAGPGATGPVGSSTVTPVVTIDAKGRITALGSAAIASVAGLSSSLSAAATSGGSTVTIAVQPSWVRAGQRIIIDPYTSICEAAIISSVSGTTVTLSAVLASNHTLGTVVLAPQDRFLNVEWWGANNGASGQQVPINAAATAAGTVGSGAIYGGIYLPRGDYSTSDQILIPSQAQMLGDGWRSTQISPASDFGSGKFVILLSDREAGENCISDIGISKSVSITPGTRPTNMHGISDGNSCRIGRVRIRGMNAAIEVRGNHGHFYDLDLGNCFDGFYFADTTGGGTVYGLGNHSFTDVKVSGNARSGWAVAGGNNISSSIFSNPEVGETPWGFFKETRTDHGFMNNTLIDQFNWENVGNGAFYDDTATGASGFTANVIRGGGGNISTTYTWAVYPVQPFKLDGFGQCEIDVGDTLIGIAHFNAPFITAVSIAGVHFHGANAGWWAALQSNGIKFAAGPADFAVAGSTYEGDDDYGIIQYLSGTISASKLVKPNGVSVAPITTTTTDVPFGYAALAGVTADVIAVQQGGKLNVTCTGTVASGSYVKPSTGTAGAVMAASSRSDGSVCGIATSGGTNTTIAVAALI